MLKTFCLRMTGISQEQQSQAFRDRFATSGKIDPVLVAMADAFIAVHAMLCQAAANLDKEGKRKAREHSVARRPMTIPGDGPIDALSIVALVADPTRFSRTPDLGAYLGFGPKRHKSGELAWSGRVSRCGGGAMRGRLCEGGVLRNPPSEAALTPEKLGLAPGQRGFRMPALATACKIASPILTLWKNETGYPWLKGAAA